MIVHYFFWDKIRVERVPIEVNRFQFWFSVAKKKKKKLTSFYLRRCMQICNWNPKLVVSNPPFITLNRKRGVNQNVIIWNWRLSERQNMQDLKHLMTGAKSTQMTRLIRNACLLFWVSSPSIVSLACHVGQKHRGGNCEEITRRVAPLLCTTHAGPLLFFFLFCNHPPPTPTPMPHVRFLLFRFLRLEFSCSRGSVYHTSICDLFSLFL